MFDVRREVGVTEGGLRVMGGGPRPDWGSP